MGPAAPTPEQIVEVFALCRSLVAATENDEPWPEPFAAPSPALFAIARLVVLLGDALGPLATAIETMSNRHPARGRLVAACAVAREWFRATTDNSAEAMRLIARLARTEAS